MNLLDLLENLYCYLFRGLNERYPNEISAVRKQYPFEDVYYAPLKRFSWPQIIELLRESGEVIGDFEDISTVQEKLLGRIIKERYNIDFYVVDQFPSAIRPFYTMPAEDPNYSNSYDFFLRGEEICSGSQRIHQAKLLRERAEQKTY